MLPGNDTLFCIRIAQLVVERIIIAIIIFHASDIFKFVYNLLLLIKLIMDWQKALK